MRIRVDKGEETVYFAEGFGLRAALEDLRDWLDEQPPEELDGITLNRSTEKTYRLTMAPLAVWMNDHAFTYDQFVDARDMFVSRVAQSGNHWL